LIFANNVFEEGICLVWQVCDAPLWTLS